MNATLKGFIKKELAQALRDPRMRILIFGVPLIQLTVFGLALSNEIKNIRLAVSGKPQDVRLWRVRERALASRWFIPAPTNESDPWKIIETNAADAVLVAPPEGLTRSIERGEGRLQLLVNASNAIRARSIESYMQAILLQEAPQTESGRAPPPIFEMDVRMLFNPSMRSPVYLVPGVMSLIMCLVTIILTSMSMAREKEIGTFETLISAPVSKTEILLGKTIPFVILGMMDVPLVVGAAVLLFNVPMRGELWELVLVSFFFVCTTVSVGTLISTFAKNQQQAMMGGFLFLFPAIQLSGVMVPLDNIPLVFKVVAALNPLNYFVAVIRNIMLKGGNPWMVWTHIGALALLAAVAITITARRFHQTLN